MRRESARRCRFAVKRRSSILVLFQATNFGEFILDTTLSMSVHSHVAGLSVKRETRVHAPEIPLLLPLSTPVTEAF